MILYLGEVYFVCKISGIDIHKETASPSSTYVFVKFFQTFSEFFISPFFFKLKHVFLKTKVKLYSKLLFWIMCSCGLQFIQWKHKWNNFNMLCMLRHEWPNSPTRSYLPVDGQEKTPICIISPWACITQKLHLGCIRNVALYTRGGAIIHMRMCPAQWRLVSTRLYSTKTKCAHNTFNTADVSRGRIKKCYKMFKNILIISLAYLDSPWEIQSNKSKHAKYWFSISWNSQNFRIKKWKK